MPKSNVLTLNLRSQQLCPDKRGWNHWQVVERRLKVPAAKTLILVCDMWDTHVSQAAAQRVNALAPRMDRVLKQARSRGVQIVHAPNDCMDFYAGTPARLRMKSAPHCQPPAGAPHDEPPAPLSPGSDSPAIDTPCRSVPWIRQNERLHIDHERDGISVSGSEVYNYMQQHGVTQYVIMGVHTNCCILARTFGIKQMVRWGVPTALVRDLTDALYNPAQAPYVSHDEGTALVVGYIERFWCPTISSDEL